ncbi:hypothetical protein IQ254_17455 [Nodosilinea sp. LEGE 07088]|uniref:hypothetical protein n=1 Tax=Nodosilinea sp. LEGE 07088 TaxID=2777968 RepID=UPI00187F68D3|nr:hypothetical protein [Nodosilinea sp. LEGE 07088]MBE9138956.1 hypothetical protein [Nodosilinea sp. LEGE 07088]
MGSVTGTDSHTASGYVGAAIVGSSITLSFKDFVTAAEGDALEAYLTIRGNMAKRPIALGTLPATSGAFDLSVPEGTDISLFNTLIIRPVGSEATVAKASVP